MRLIRSDWIIIAGFLLFFTSHMTTNFLIKYYENEAQTIGEAKEIVQIMEVNPFARGVFMFNNLRILYQFIIMPIFFFGAYYYWRKKFMEANPELLETIAMMVFMSGLLNASNDVSIMFGVVMS